MNISPHYLQDAVRSPIRRLAPSAANRLFATAETDGYRIYETDTLLPVARKDVPNGSLSLVVPFYDSDLLFLVGGPPSPLYAPNKVVLFSLALDQAIASIEFASAVLGLCVRRDRLVVALRSRIVLFALPLGPKPIYREGMYETCENPKGLACMATDDHATLLCIPGRQPGQMALVKLPPCQGYARPDPPNPLNQPPFPATFIVLAHTTSLSALSITPDGRLVATASVKGTLIRLWDSKTGSLVREVRRGSDSADIFSLAIHPAGRALAAASDKGTVHLWDLSHPSHQDDSRPASRARKASSNEGVALLKPYLPKYFSSSWSDGQLRLPPPEAQTPRNLAFLDVLSQEKRERALTTEDDHVLVCWSAAADEEPCLIAVTHSGGWYKVALTRDDMGKSKEDWGTDGRCRLVDSRHFESRDGW